MKSKRSEKVLLSLNKDEMQKLSQYGKTTGLPSATVCRMIIVEKLQHVGKPQNNQPYQ